MQPHPGAAVGAPDPGKLKNAKILRGCGGCGCVFALLLAIGGAVLIGFGMERATQEAMPFGIAASALSFLVGIVALGLLIWGIMSLKKLRG
jgi:hypothetical protein